MVRYIVIGAVCLVIVLVCSGLMSLHGSKPGSGSTSSSPPASAPKSLSDTDAINSARYAVRKAMKAPDSAKFPLADSGDYAVKKLAEKEYEVSSYVDATNSFNAKVREPWTCRLSFSGKDDANVNVAYIEVGGRTIYGAK